jgi:hypothetical protein
MTIIAMLEAAKVGCELTNRVTPTATDLVKLGSKIAFDHFGVLEDVDMKRQCIRDLSGLNKCLQNVIYRSATNQGRRS